MKLHEILFWFLILLLPTQLGKHFWPDFSLVFGIRVDYLSPTIYLTDILVILTLGFWIAEKIKYQISKIKITKQNSKSLIFLFSVFCFLLFNALLAQNQGAAFYKLVKITEFSLLGLYVAKNNLLITNYKLPITLAIIYSSLIALAQFFKQASLGGIFYWLGERSFNVQTPGIALADLGGRLFLRPYGTFSHPNSLAGFILVALILLLGNSKSTNQLINKLTNLKFEIGQLNDWIIKSYWSLVFILGFSALVLSFSHSVWLVGLLAGLWFTAYGIWRKRKISPQITNYYLLITFSVLLLLTGLVLFFNPGFLADEPVILRLQLIKVAILMIKENLLSGVGLNNFVVRLPEYWQTGSIRFLQPVHNIYLLILAETGMAGFLIFLWFLVLTFRKLLEIGNLKLVIPLLAILLTGVVDHYWLTLQQNQLLATIVFGLAWGKIKS
ncbi:MAG: O-antigen ligase family protein [Patescibacteria group bacterium]